MQNNFHRWREAKQASFTSIPDMHFHKCSDIHFGVVRDLLQTIVSCYVSHGQRKFVLQPSEFDINCFLLFLDEMQFAYIHPRSTSARVAYVRTFKSSATPLTL